MALKVFDDTGTNQNMSTSLDALGNLVGATCVTDPVSGVKQNVVPFVNSDGNSTAVDNAALVASVGLDWNGVNFDRRRNNADATTSAIAISAAAAGTLTSVDMTNHNHRGLQLGINITAIGASTNLTVTIQGKDVVSGVYYTLLASTAIAATGFTLLTVYPGAPVAANSSTPQVLPRTFNIKAVIAGSNTVTATIGMSVIL